MGIGKAKKPYCVSGCMYVCMYICRALCFTSTLGSSTSWTATANNYACTAAMGCIHKCTWQQTVCGGHNNYYLEGQYTCIMHLCRGSLHTSQISHLLLHPSHRLLTCTCSSIVIFPIFSKPNLRSALVSNIYEKWLII